MKEGGKRKLVRTEGSMNACQDLCVQWVHVHACWDSHVRCVQVQKHLQGRSCTDFDVWHLVTRWAFRWN